MNKVLLPIIRRVEPTVIANEILGIKKPLNKLEQCVYDLKVRRAKRKIKCH